MQLRGRPTLGRAPPQPMYFEIQATISEKVGSQLRSTFFGLVTAAGRNDAVAARLAYLASHSSDRPFICHCATSQNPH